MSDREKREKSVLTHLLGDPGAASRVQSNTDTLPGNKWLMLKGNSMAVDCEEGQCLDGATGLVASEMLLLLLLPVEELKLR